MGLDLLHYDAMIDSADGSLGVFYYVFYIASLFVALIAAGDALIDAIKHS